MNGSKEHKLSKLFVYLQQKSAAHKNGFEVLVVKLREREGQGVDPGRSLKGHLWMVDGGWWYTFP